MRETTLREMMAKKPEKVVELAVKGMLQRDLWEEACLQSFMYMQAQSMSRQHRNQKF